MVTSVLRATPTRPTDPLQVHAFEPEDLGSLLGLLEGAQLSYLCVASGHLRRAATGKGIDWTEGAIVAAAAEGVVGFALIERVPDEKVGQLTVALDPRWARGAAPGRLLDEAAAVARRLGLEKLETQLCRQTSVRLFQDAGLRTLSSMSMGGVTDVTLAVR